MILGALAFLVAVLLLGYLPGKLILGRPTPALPPLEHAALACVFGLIASACAYWVAAYLGVARGFHAWTVAIVVIALVLRRHGPREPRAAWRWEPQHTALAAVLAVGVVTLAILPQFYSNLALTPEGGLTNADHGDDAAYHIAIASELTHSVPPQAPVFAGEPLVYHYGMNLLVAMFSAATGLEPRDLILRFVSTLVLFLATTTTFCFCRRWLGSGPFAALAAFLVYFGEDFSFLPGLLLGWRGDWSLAFGVPSMHSLFLVNPIRPALGLLFAALLCVLAYTREGGRRWLLLSVVALAALAQVKVFTAAHLMASLGIAALVHLALFRDGRLFRVAAFTALLVLPLALADHFRNRAGAEILVLLEPWPYVRQAMERLDLAGAPFAIALPIYLVGCLGLRVIALPRTVRAVVRPERDGGVRFLLGAFVLLGIVLTLTVRIVPRDVQPAYNNSVWFLGQSKYVGWVFVVEVLMAAHRRLRARGLVAVLACALALPSTVQHFVHVLTRPPVHAGRMRDRSRDPAAPPRVATSPPAYRGGRVHAPDGVAAVRFLAGRARPGDVVLTVPDLLDPVLVLTRCRVPVAYFAEYLVPLSAVHRRREAIAEFWTAWGRGELRLDLWRELGVDHVVAAGPAPALPSELVLAYDEAGYVVVSAARSP